MRNRCARHHTERAGTAAAAFDLAEYASGSDDPLPLAITLPLRAYRPFNAAAAGGTAHPLLINGRATGVLSSLPMARKIMPI